MLEQAIIDAAALREAALKNAEQAIIEKYAPEVKAAVAQLLESDGSRFTKGQTVNYEGRQATVTVESEEGQVGIKEENGKTYLVQESDLQEVSDSILEEESDVVEEEDKSSGIPMAAVDLTGEGLEEGEQVIFEFTADDFLEEEKDQPAGESGLDAMSGESTAAVEPAEPETTQPGEGAKEPDDVLNLTEEEDTLQELIDILNEFNEEETLEEETLEEELVVDMAGEHKDGTFQTDEGTLEYYQEMELAKQEATKAKEDNEELSKKLEELDEVKKNFEEKNNQLLSVIEDLNEKLQSTLLSNAKLLYSNRALNDASLNERQKTKIVEAINKAQSVEEAKNLHETLRVTVGQTQRRGPQSLNETVSRRSNLSSMMTSKKQNSAPTDNFSERMRRLAGIK
tara:strand:+ start:15201 stop:16394 length:1194 start_codon:yes stop_codon:yes gene_type:complete